MQVVRGDDAPGGVGAEVSVLRSDLYKRVPYGVLRKRLDKERKESSHDWYDHFHDLLDLANLEVEVLKQGTAGLEGMAKNGLAAGSCMHTVCAAGRRAAPKSSAASIEVGCSEDVQDPAGTCTNHVVGLLASCNASCSTC